jgi:hypothetical protein
MIDHAPPMPTETGVFILLTIAAWITWEIFAVMTNKQTLSNAIWRFSNLSPSMRFLTGLTIGLLLGHWFW